jgi:hypothetical protein
VVAAVGRRAGSPAAGALPQRAPRWRAPLAPAHDGGGPRTLEVFAAQAPAR